MYRILRSLLCLWPVRCNVGFLATKQSGIGYAHSRERLGRAKQGMRTMLGHARLATTPVREHSGMFLSGQRTITLGKKSRKMRSSAIEQYKQYNIQ